ncbi:hypothetical protein [Bradyrhizobium sp.]|uniref:hypothetical protein n=1 Tax=Bradyrhizobium sp. TaxID=376 RepID=UPI000B0BF821
MITRTLIAIVAAAALAVPAMAQSTDTEKNGHHYSGGPKTEVPHHMGKKDMGTVGSSKETVAPPSTARREAITTRAVLPLRRPTTWATRSNDAPPRSRRREPSRTQRRTFSWSSSARQP